MQALDLDFPLLSDWNAEATHGFGVAYEHNGRRLTTMPYHQSVLHDVTSIYEECSGWQQDLSFCREVADLPGKARDYLDLLEREVGVPVTFVGTGPGRDQYVHLHA